MAERPVPRLRSAAVWSYAENIGKMVITTGVTLLLAAMLGPKAYGIIAMALVFTNFIEMLQQQGMMPAIISQKDLTGRHADTAFWIVVVIGLACTSIGVAVAPLWAELNRTPELTHVIWALAVTIPLTSTAVVHEAILRRELRFRELAIRTWASAILAGLAGVAAALIGWGVWALVAQQVVMSVVSVIALWIATRWRPSVRFSRDDARELWQYSLRASSSSFAVFLANRVDVILAGAFFGPVVVGLYRMGQRLTSMVVTVAGRAMHSVSLPGLARLQDDGVTFRRSLSQMQRATAALVLPSLAVVAGIAPDIELVLGAEWTGTAPVIRILAVGQMINSLSLLLGPSLQAMRRPGLLAIILWLWSGAVVMVIVLAAQVSTENDILALCLAMCVGYLIGAGLHVGFASRALELPVRSMVRSWVPGIVSAAAAGAVSTLLTAELEFGHPFLDLCVAAGVGGITAIVVGTVLVPGWRRSTSRRLANVTRRRGTSRTIGVEGVEGEVRPD